MNRVAYALCGLAVATGVAQADPLPVVERAGDANLEPDGPHTGDTFTFGLIASNIITADSTGDVGRGPGLSFRLGMAATPDTLVTLELTGGSMLHEHDSKLFTNDDVDVLVGGQYFLKQSLWLRGAAGQCWRASAPGCSMSVARRSLIRPGLGPAALFGLGLDLLRRHKFMLGLEVFTSLVVELDRDRDELGARRPRPRPSSSRATPTAWTARTARWRPSPPPPRRGSPRRHRSSPSRPDPRPSPHPRRHPACRRCRRCHPWAARRRCP